jgi:hypothetical protein
MNSEAVIRMERITNDMPVPRGGMSFSRTKTPEGEIYYAIGRGLHWHFIYGFDGPDGAVACPGSADSSLTRQEIESNMIVIARKELAILNTSCKK